jgi:hypothetical protein
VSTLQRASAKFNGSGLRDAQVPVDFEDAQFCRHRAAAPHDHHDVGQERTEFTRHHSHQQRPQQLGLPRLAGPEGELDHNRHSDEHRHRADKPERFDADGQNLPRKAVPHRAHPETGLHREEQDGTDHRRRVTQFIPLPPHFLSQPANRTHNGLR